VSLKWAGHLRRLQKGLQALQESVRDIPLAYPPEKLFWENDTRTENIEIGNGKRGGDKRRGLDRRLAR